MMIPMRDTNTWIERAYGVLPAAIAASAFVLLLGTSAASAQTAPATASVPDATSAQAENQPANPVIATVNGLKITRAQILAVNPAAASNPAQFEQTLQQFINTVLLYQAALRDKLDVSPAVKNAIEAQRQQVLVNAAESVWFEKHPIDDADIKARYEQLVKTLPKEQWRLREIVVTDRAQADAVLDALKTGQRFSDLAAQHPDSPNSALGGEIGWVNPKQLPAGLEETLQGLQVGQVAGPLVVPQGLAIVQLLGRRATEVPALDAVRGQIVQQLRNESLLRYFDALRKDAKIDVTATSPQR
jgi:peptidyl-prolyl cis-trans isomerase C